MKRALIGTLAGILLLTAGTVGAFAVGPRSGQTLGNRDGVCDHPSNCSFTDTDGDGICDYDGTNCSTGTNCFFVDADGDGICDHAGTNCPNGANCSFVDADGDGICDTMGTAGSNGYRHCGSNSGTGAGWGHGCRGGHNR